MTVGASAIVGYVGARPAADVLLECLGGPDDGPRAAAGIAILAGRETHVRRATGPVAALRRLVASTPAPGRVGVGHWRRLGAAATPLAPSTPAHASGVSVALHGRLPGGSGLRARVGNLTRLGPGGARAAVTGTDGELLAHLIAHHRRDGESLLAACLLAWPAIDGPATFLAMCEEEPDTLVFSCGREPLLLGVGADGVVIGSERDVVDEDLHVQVALEAGDTGVVQQGLELHVFDLAGQLVRRPRR